VRNLNKIQTLQRKKNRKQTKKPRNFYTRVHTYEETLTRSHLYIRSDTRAKMSREKAYGKEEEKENWRRSNIRRII